MFLQRKKGDIVTPFVILLVLAIIMIFVVTGFGVKIIQSFYPSGDKSTVRSFDALYNVINMNVVSTLDYEMTSVNIYLKKDYCIVLFYSPVVSKGNYGVPGSEIYYAPTECGKNQCICLYDNTPKQDLSKKDKYVIKCSVFSGNISINQSLNDISPSVCSSSGERYIPLLIIGNTELNKHYTYILNDNVERNKLADALKIRTCPATSPELCRGKKDGVAITFSNDEGLDKIRTYCANPKNGTAYKSTSIKCVYNDDQKNCIVDCSKGDVSNDCHTTYQKCADFNQLDGEVAKYISMDKNYEYYYMCKNDVNYCNLSCQVYPLEVYVSNNSESWDYSGTVGQVAGWLGYIENYPLLTNNIIRACDLKFTDRLPGGERYVLSYNESNQTCVDIMNNYFYPGKSTILTCKSATAACEKLISDRRSECTIKSYSDGKYLWISYYDSQKPNCDTDIKQLFSPMYFCGDKPKV